MSNRFNLSDFLINCLSYVPFVRNLITATYINKNSYNYPYQIEIELSSKCNATCLHCPHRYLSSRNNIMTTETFNKIVCELKRYPPFLLIIAGLGEPFTDLAIDERLNILRKVLPKTFIKIFSNGSLIDSKISLSLIENRIDELIVTIDDFDPEKYRYLTGLELEVVLSNLELLKSLRNLNKSNKPKIFINQTIFTPEKINMKLSPRSSKYCDHRLYFQFDDWAGEIKNPFTSENLNSDFRKTYPCFYLWNTMNIHSNGVVSLCCQDYDENYPIGNINQASIFQIWNSIKLNQYRIWHKNKANFKIRICSHCKYRLRGFDLKSRMFKRFNFK